MERAATLQLPTAAMDTIDYETPARLIRPLPGRFYAIEHGPTQRIGQIWLSDGAGTSLQSDLLTVLAVGEGVSFCPGDRILVRPTHGDWIEGFEVSGYKAPQRVRVYGLACEFQGKPKRVAWWECAPVRAKSLTTGAILAAERLRSSGYLPNIVSVNNMVLEATGRNIIIKRDPVIRSESGLELPESAQYRTSLATVVSVGGQVRDVKAGDRVHYAPMALLDFMFGEDKDLAVCQELGINAVIATVAKVA